MREVVRQWVTCGLAIPVAWARPQESPDWLLLDRIDERSTQSLDPSLGVLNRLGARSELRVVVLISSLASTVETEPTVDESEVVAQPLPASATVLQTIQSIYDDINRNFGPGEVPFILVVIPPSRDRTGPLATGEDMHSTLTRTVPWRDIFVVAPEDAPDPGLGNEVSTISDPAVAHALPPSLDRPVSWEEVKERVLGRICVHCHMNDHERDPGPGHVGGFGWPAAGLRMRTYESLVSGMPCADPLEAPRGGAPVAVGTLAGERCSVLVPRLEGGVPPLLEVMLLRHDEEPRDRVAPAHDHARPSFASARPGMPMGLPSIPDDEIALVRAWIEQGCVGPVAVTGMPGIPDGYLVPDGPIERNRGCEVRAPSPERPSWASQPPPAFWHD